MKALTLGVVFFHFVSSCFAVKLLDEIGSPCSYKDNECIVGLWQKATRLLAAGSEEFNVPPLDPLKVDNIDVDVPGLVYLHFDGVMRGLKGCVYDSSRTAVKKGHFKQVLDLHCNVTLKGNYNVTANTTVLFGPGSEGLLEADGIGKVKLDNLSFKFLLDLDIKRNEDGVIKFRIKDGPIGYRYKIGGPVKFDVSKIYFGSEDLTRFVVTFINQNWRFVMDVFGDFFFQKAMKIVSEFPKAVVNAIPAKSYFTEDMDQYVLD